jgi:hypothetical protein
VTPEVNKNRAWESSLGHSFYLDCLENKDDVRRSYLLHIFFLVPPFVKGNVSSNSEALRFFMGAVVGAQERWEPFRLFVLDSSQVARARQCVRMLFAYMQLSRLLAVAGLRKNMQNLGCLGTGSSRNPGIAVPSSGGPFWIDGMPTWLNIG